MQTFLPYEDYDGSARCLDDKRLGKQRVEAHQILNALDPNYPKKGWKDHPAVKMWSSYEKSLCRYGIACCKEWIRRGFKDSLLPKFEQRYAQFPGSDANPPWLGRKLTESHRSNLVRKDVSRYLRYFPGVQLGLPYHWPV